MQINSSNSGQAQGARSSSSTGEAQNESAVAGDRDRGDRFSLERRQERKEREDKQQDQKGGHGPPSGGPLSLRPACRKPDVGFKSLAAAAEKLVDRVTVGQNRGGLPEVRLDISAGALAGAQVRLAAGKNGIEAIIVVPPDAARHVVEGQLSQLAKTLEQKGITLSHCEVLDRNQQQARDQRQNRQRQNDANGGSA